MQGIFLSKCSTQLLLGPRKAEDLALAVAKLLYLSQPNSEYKDLSLNSSDSVSKEKGWTTGGELVSFSAHIFP